MNIRTDLAGTIVGAVFLIAPVLQVSAAETHPCSVVTEDASRLDCYDAAFGKPAARSVAPAPAAVAAPVAAAPSSVAAPGAASAGVAAATAAADPVQTFGFDGLPPEQKKAQKATTPQAPESITSVITSVNKRLLGELIVELDNGQVWEQIETDPSVRLQVGATATISKGALGSYKLVSGTNSTKVKRIR